MRPQKLTYLIQNAIDHWLETKDNSKFLPILDDMECLWFKWYKGEEDYRTGMCVYDYGDEKSIFYNMMYISDRWKCAFRLKWIIDGVRGGSI